jgi:DNA-directed RNA polymerase subunit RPC12/RpoP
MGVKAVWRSYDEGVDRYLCSECRKTVYNVTVGNFCQHCGGKFTGIIKEEEVRANRADRLRHKVPETEVCPIKKFTILEEDEKLTDGVWEPWSISSKVQDNIPWYGWTTYTRQNLLKALHSVLEEYDHYKRSSLFSYICWDDEDADIFRTKVTVVFTPVVS